MRTDMWKRALAYAVASSLFVVPMVYGLVYNTYETLFLVGGAAWVACAIVAVFYLFYEEG